MKEYQTGLVKFQISPKITKGIAMRKAIEMSNWCKEYNLVSEKDYVWYLHEEEVHFMFNNPKYATLMILRFDNII